MNDFNGNNRCAFPTVTQTAVSTTVDVNNTVVNTMINISHSAEC